MYELWQRRGFGPWRSLREDRSEENLNQAARREVSRYEERGIPVEFVVTKVGDFPEKATTAQFGSFMADRD